METPNIKEILDSIPHMGEVTKIERVYTVALDAGHYLGTDGRRVIKSADPKETREWVLNARVADRLESFLAFVPQIATIRVDDSTGKTDVPLATRAKRANDSFADLYISIHHNAGVNGGSGGGITAYSFPGSAAGAAWRDDLYSALIAATGLKGNRAQPLQTADFAVLRWTEAPAVLLELGFMDSVSDAPEVITEQHAQDCARAIASVILRRFGVEEPFDNNVAPAPAEPLRYNTLDEMPEWAREPISALIDAGILEGVSSTELQLDLTEEMVRTFALVGRVWMRV